MQTYGVIFDMDGVLVLTEEAHWLSWREAAARHGVELAYETFLSCFGRVNADCVRIMIGEHVSEDEARVISEEKEAAMRAIIAEAIPLAPSLADLLGALRADGARLAVGSSAPKENVDLILDRGGIRQHFAVAVDGGQVRRGKPAPDVFLLAAEGMGLPPAACAVVEDAPAGILAARAAGMIALGLATTHEARELKAAGAHAVYEAMPSLSAEIIRGAIVGSARAG